MTYELLIGTYTRKTSSEGVYAYSISGEGDNITLMAVNRGIDNPSFLIQHPYLDVVFAVNEVADFTSSNSRSDSGAVSAFSSENGRLEVLNQRPSLGADPCHLSISAQGKCLLVANYSGGSFTSFPISADGSLGEFVSAVQHKGMGINPTRQTGAHVHSTTFGPSGEFVYVADLGTDQVIQYPVDDTGQVGSQASHAISLKAGAGPRHFCFSGGFGYLLNELDNTVISFRVDVGGQLKVLHTHSSLPDTYSSPNDGAHIEASRDGKYLYASNRGHDSIVVFKIGLQGKLEQVQFQPTLGRHPRHFTFSPDQEFMLVANRDTNNVVVFKRDSSTGLLTETGNQFEVPSPVFLLPMPIPNRC
ncbi:MAG: lactonase family protein [bacterium]|nr:lactonase family protein [Gammaproteobacteria bacterium]HIL94380.1 lactonase family protein [Pseudomonadales bacterium]